MGDFRFFGLENPNGNAFQAARDELSAFYDEQHQSYQEHKKVFHKEGRLFRVIKKQNGVFEQGKKPVELISHLGGTAAVGNMVWMPSNNGAFTYTDPETAPRSRDGRPFLFIASVPGWHYRDFGPDEILLYYDPVQRVVLQTFVWG